MDVPLVLLVVAAAVALIWIWTQETYGNPRAFPRDASEFRPPAILKQDKATVEAVLQKDPENIAALIDLALICFEEGRFAYVPGLEALEKARDLGALDERLFYYAGVMYETQGLTDFAVPEYEKFLRHRPDDLETRLRLGNLFYRIGEPDKAIEQYQKVRAHKAEDPLVAFNLAVAYRDREQWTDGLKVLEEAQRSGQRLPQGEHKLFGDLYRGAGNLSKAMEHYQAELMIRRDDPELWEAMAQGYEQMGDEAQALEYWRRFSDLSPKNRKAKDKVRALERKVRAAERKAKQIQPTPKSLQPDTTPQ